MVSFKKMDFCWKEEKWKKEKKPFDEDSPIGISRRSDEHRVGLVFAIGSTFHLLTLKCKKWKSFFSALVKKRKSQMSSFVKKKRQSQLNVTAWFSEPPAGIEPATYWLQVSCSTSWAKEAFNIFISTSRLLIIPQVQDSTSWAKKA